MSVCFELYPEEKPWWSFSDYQTVLNVLARTDARTVLEFGPGSSTLALVEGGAEAIDACEDDEEWAKVAEERLLPTLPGVTLVRYNFCDPLTIPALDDKRYDLALIDGPRKTPLRPVVLRYALPRCRFILMPTEEWHSESGQWMRPIIAREAEALERPVEFIETGPLSGAFALIGPPPVFRDPA